MAVHSSKGGTGKTCISMNIAAVLARKGYNVCLLDMDLKAPSMCTFFNKYPKWWLNEYLEGDCDISTVLHEISSQLGTNSRFIIGLSNPDISAIRKISRERKWQAKALKLLIDAKKAIFLNGIDVIVLDTGPGIEFESVNAIAISDMVLSVMIPNKISYKCTEQLVKGVYMTLEKKCYFVENMSHASSVDLSRTKDIFGIPVITSIPCMCDVPLKNENQMISLTYPDHLFTASLRKICCVIEDNMSKE